MVRVRTPIPLPLPWATKIPPFCEGTAWNWSSEYVSAFTALFISSVGLYGLTMNYLQGAQSRNFFALFVLNGIASFGFHWTLERGWDFLDKWTMVVAAWLIAYYVLDVIGSFYAITNNVVDEVIAKKNVDVRITTEEFNAWTRRYIGLTSLISIFTNFTMVLTLVISAITPPHSALFSILFTIPIVLVIIVAFVMVWRFEVLHGEILEGFPDAKEQEEVFAVTKKRSILGIYVRGCIVGGIGAVLWQITENTCPFVPAVRFLFGHALWHILFTYGMYCILVSFLALRYELLFGSEWKWVNACPLCESWNERVPCWFYFCPAVDATQRFRRVELAAASFSVHNAKSIALELGSLAVEVEEDKKEDMDLVEDVPFYPNVSCCYGRCWC